MNPNRVKPLVPPLGLEYLSDALRLAGHEVLFFDLGFRPPASLFELARRKKPDIIGVSIRNLDDVTLLRKHNYVPGIVRLVRELHRVSDARIVLGGAGFSILPRELMEVTGADFGISGDGEEAMVGLLNDLGQPQHIPRVWFREGGPSGPVRFSFEGLSGSWGAGCSPRSLLDYEGYLRRGSSCNVQTKRGCTHRCLYCPEPRVMGQRMRLRPAEAVAEEFEILASMGVRERVFLVDSEFNLVEEHALEVCRILTERASGVKWVCSMTPKYVTEELIGLMKRAGCDMVIWSVDSVSDATLQSLRKDIEETDVLRVCGWCEKAGLPYCLALLLGGPAETPDTIKATFRNAGKTRAAFIAVGVGLRIYPGTGLHEVALAEGQVTRETDFLQPVYYREAWVRDTLIPLVRTQIAEEKRAVMFGSRPDVTVEAEIRKVYPVPF